MARTGNLRRKRAHAHEGGETLFFWLEGVGKSGRLVQTSQVPDFDGEEATVEFEIKGGSVSILRLIDPHGRPAH